MNAPLLTAVREDWQDFLAPDGSRRRAGWRDLAAVLVKEVLDNAHDAAATNVTATVEDGALVVTNDGPALAIRPEALFSLRRPLTSAKACQSAGPIRPGCLRPALRPVAPRRSLPRLIRP